MDRIPLTRLHLAAVALCTLGFAFELFEISLGSALGAIFAMPGRHVSTDELSWLLASVYLGAIVGAPLFGGLADRLGRRRLLVAAMAWLGMTSTVAVFCPDLGSVAWARAGAGIALGAYPPLMMSYLTDVLPSSRRGQVIFWSYGIACLGLPGSVFLVRGLGTALPMGLEAWRVALLAGGMGATACAVGMLRLPESPRWLHARGRHVEAEVACAHFERSRSWAAAAPLPSVPCASAEPVARTSHLPTSPWLRLVPLFALSPVATVAFPLLMGTLLALRGFRLPDALLFVGLFHFGPAVGSLASSALIDRIERRLALSLCAVVLMLAGAAFVFVDSAVWLGIAAVTLGICAVLYTAVMNLYASELFPTTVRAASSAVAWSVNRAGAAASVLVFVPLLKNEGGGTLFAVVATSLLSSIVLLAGAPRGLQRQAVA